MAGLISIHTSTELRATIALLKTVDADISKQIKRSVRTVSTNEWQGYVSSYNTSPLQSRVLTQTANVTVSNTNVNLRAANSSKRMRGGATPQLLAKVAEFGTNRQESFSTYQRRSTKGNSFQVKRRVSRGLPTASRTGWAVYPAASLFAPRMASLWTQTTMRTFYEAIEKGRR